VNFGRIAGKVKQVIDRRGGSKALKEDVSELSDIAKGKGGVGDKAKGAAEAIKDPGAPGDSGAKPRTRRTPAK
jgi:hypothetical protein